MSLFVNPAQFGPGEDYDRYPRDERQDAELAAAAGVDLLFAPPLEEVYPEGFSTSVEVAGLTDVLCGAPASRGRSHFTRRRDHRRQAAQHVRPRRGLLRPEGLPAVRRDPPAGARPRTSRSASRSAPRSASRTAWRSAPATRTSTRSSASEPRASTRRWAPPHRPRGRAPARAQVRDAALAVLGGAGVEPEYVEVLRADDLARRGGTGERLVVAIAAPVGPRASDRQHIDRASQRRRAPAHEVALAGG